ncbi:MAG: FKBP-type peptidyl-prolyl cis-trans isomerase [Spirochaetales bacterium]|nr:FKBP-type peptidyl-prolyl cis-trans isomerase [Spirochaetales bacterium]
MLRKFSVLLVLLVLVIALGVSCSSKGSKDDGEIAAQAEKTVEVSQASEVVVNAEVPEEGAEEEIDRSSLTNPETLIEKFSYAMGVYVADAYGVENAPDYYGMFQMYYLPEIDSYYGFLGIYDYMNGSLLYTIEELNQIMSDYYDDYDMRMAALADENLARAEAFLAENAKKEGIRTTESGLQYEIVRQGEGALAKATDSVELDYELTLMDGTVIDSSYARGDHSTFPLSGVIPGFSEGVMLMPMGSEYVFYIHPSLGYGDQATGSMGPNSLLIFKVETYSIQGE